MKKIISILFLSFMSIFFTGCYIELGVTKVNLAPSNHINASVQIQVDHMETVFPEIKISEYIQKMLLENIKDANLFREVVAKDADYKLLAHIVYLDHPIGHGTRQSTSEIVWVLTKGDEVVYKKSISIVNKEEIGSLQLSMNDNIKQALTEISQLNLQ